MAIVYINIICYKLFMKFINKFLLFYFLPLCTEIYGDEYLIDKLKIYFDSINWAQADSVVVQDITQPFNLSEADSDSVFAYADTLKDDSVFPAMGGLGTLDYSGVDGALIAFLREVCKGIKEKKLDMKICIPERPFLPHLFNYRFQQMPEVKKIDAVYFSRPSFTAQDKAKTEVRFNYAENGKNVYRLMILEAAKKENNWLLEAFDFKGEKNDGSTDKD